MKSISFLALGVSLLAFAGAAHAADLSRPAPVAAAAPAVVAKDWTGFYLGAFGGYGWGTISPDGLADEAATGGVAGVQAGYDMQSGNIVCGVQTELSKSWLAWTAEDPADTIDWLGSTTARVGVAFDNLLPYLKGGVAYGGGTGHNAGLSASANSIGWTVGGGLELAVTDQISVFGEYDYYSLGKATLDFGPGSIDASTTASVAKAGLNFHF